MNTELYRIQGIKGIIDLIRVTSEAHLAVAEFKVGEQLETDNNQKLYPVAFLESGISSDVEGDSEAFSVALSIGDRLPKDYSSEDLVNLKSKVSQILDEIHYVIENLSTSILVTGMNKLFYEDVNQDSIVICRGEFQITIARYTAKGGQIPMDSEILQQLRIYNI